MEEYSCELDLQSIQRTVLKIIAGHLGLILSELHLEDDLVKDLGADELDQKELTMTIEESFRIRFKEGDLVTIKCIGDITNIVQNYCSEHKRIENRK